ncbi:MAG: MoaD/ThiS family protein [Desulfosudaceae bacterium]
MSITVEIFLYASLAAYLPDKTAGRSMAIETAAGSRVADVLPQIGVPDKEVKLIFINGARKELHHSLADGDRVGLFPPVGGG